MLCWRPVAWVARPARACWMACLTVASSPVSAGASGSELAASFAPLPLAVFFSFLFAFLASFLGASAFFSLVLVEAAFLSLALGSGVVAFALAVDLALVALVFAAGDSDCAIAVACSPIPAIPTSSSAVSKPWALVNVPVLPSAREVALP